MGLNKVVVIDRGKAAGIRPPGEAVDGCSGCLATLRRGGGGPPFWRKATAAVVAVPAGK